MKLTTICAWNSIRLRMNQENIYAAFKIVMKSAKLKGKNFYMTLRQILTVVK